jgi:hypothetical protein
MNRRAAIFDKAALDCQHAVGREKTVQLTFREFTAPSRDLNETKSHD